MRSVDLGLITLDYPSWQDCVDDAVRRGLTSVEVYLDAGTTEHDVVDLATRCAEGGVTVRTIASLAKLSQAEDDLDQHLGLVRLCLRSAAAAGCANVGFMYGGCALSNRLTARDRFLRRLEPLVGEATTRGVRLLVENVFSRSPAGDLDTVEHTLAVFEHLDPEVVGLNFDVGNFAIAGEEAFPYAYEVLRPYIGGVHLKDVARYWEPRHVTTRDTRPLLDHARGLFVTEALGEGSVNMGAFLRALLAWDDRPPLMLEPFCGGARRADWLDRSQTFVAEVVAATEEGAHAHRR